MSCSLVNTAELHTHSFHLWKPDQAAASVLMMLLFCFWLPPPLWRNLNSRLPLKVEVCLFKLRVKPSMKMRRDSTVCPRLGYSYSEIELFCERLLGYFCVVFKVCRVMPKLGILAGASRWEWHKNQFIFFQNWKVCCIHLLVSHSAFGKASEIQETSYFELLQTGTMQNRHITLDNETCCFRLVLRAGF